MAFRVPRGEPHVWQKGQSQRSDSGGELPPFLRRVWIPAPWDPGLATPAAQLAGPPCAGLVAWALRSCRAVRTSSVHSLATMASAAQGPRRRPRSTGSGRWRRSGRPRARCSSASSSRCSASPVSRQSPNRSWSSPPPREGRCGLYSRTVRDRAIEVVHNKSLPSPAAAAAERAQVRRRAAGREARLRYTYARYGSRSWFGGRSSRSHHSANIAVGDDIRGPRPPALRAEHDHGRR